MMKKKIVIAALVFIIVGAIAADALIYWYRIRPVGILPSPADITQLIPETGSTSTAPRPGQAGNATNMPLSIPPGFSLTIFTKDIPGARVLAFDSFGNLWVSQTGQGTVTSLQLKDGRVQKQTAVFRNLNKPHGLALDPKNQNMFYIASEDAIHRVALYSEDTLHKIADLPSGEGHFTRTLGFGPDGRLYVSIGSSCNVCHEDDERRAAIYSMNPDGSDFKKFARGLRNAVFFTWKDGVMWATENSRDLLGDDVPPDEVNIVRGRGNYGWPICYGKNVHDTQFDANTYVRNPCMAPLETPSFIDIQAHSAPLGLAFVPSSWPAEYRGSLLVAYHGSWNRSVPTGYKVARFTFDAEGNPVGTQDFIAGWLTPDGVLGRPVDLVFGPDGALYISDDKAGVIYRLAYVGP